MTQVAASGFSWHRRRVLCLSWRRFDRSLVNQAPINHGKRANDDIGAFNQASFYGAHSTTPRGRERERPGRRLHLRDDAGVGGVGGKPGGYSSRPRRTLLSRPVRLIPADSRTW